jgi:Mce-associated membrane protein
LATVPAASSVSATPDHAVVLVFVNQTIVMGSDPPTNTASSVKVSMEKRDGHWLISSFDPV